MALTLTPIATEFGISSTSVRYTTCALFIGLCIGASFWGIASDVIGRRLAFNATLFLAGVFGLAVGGAPTWIGASALYACLGLGVGGNLPVDGALFLEFLPFASGNLLTLLSIWWPIGQLLASLSKRFSKHEGSFEVLTTLQSRGALSPIINAIRSSLPA